MYDFISKITSKIQQILSNNEEKLYEESNDKRSTIQEIQGSLIHFNNSETDLLTLKKLTAIRKDLVHCSQLRQRFQITITGMIKPLPYDAMSTLVSALGHQPIYVMHV